jgi:G3E family GTPase
MDRPRGPQPPIPVTIITGFLGAGKTTLLNRLLRDAALADTVVIVNEFGAVGLDHLLMEKADEGMVLMAAGCLCCTIKGDLIATLEDLLRRRDNGRVLPFTRVVVETTGLADPAPILHTLMLHPYLRLRYRLEGVVTVVDAINGEGTLDAHGEALKQAAVADRLLITKADLLADAAALPRLRARLAALNPTAVQLDSRDAPPAAALLDCGLYDPASKQPDVARWLNDEALLAPAGDHAHCDHDAGAGPLLDPDRHGADIRAFSFRTDRAIPSGAYSIFEELLRSAHGPRLLRVKGLVQLADNPDVPMVVHGAQHVFHPPQFLPAWPDGERGTRLVFITQGLEASFVERLWAAFAGAAPAPAA